MSENTAYRLKDEIENDIIEGRLRPRDRLDEMRLAERYGVSRTPIREALRHLAASGLVELRPHRGAVVAEIGPTRLVEMFEVMAELEAMCGRLAARRMTRADHDALRHCHERCTEAARRDSHDDYYYENVRFHATIYEATGNRFLAEHAVSLSRRLQPYRRLQLRVGNRMATSLAEHEQIVAALAAGDAERAAAALRNHVAVQGERFSDLIASLRELKTPAG
ncbi:MAG: GntR family transcriptional regulator [Xanthobacteraceae bacterium]